jgi:hypothetical protein
LQAFPDFVSRGGWHLSVLGLNSYVCPRRESRPAKRWLFDNRIALFVMPALVAGIHVLGLLRSKDVDGRDKPGHDEEKESWWAV